MKKIGFKTSVFGLLASLLVFGSGANVYAATVDSVFDYITVKATVAEKTTWYLGSDLLSLAGQEIFDAKKTNYEYTTQSDEIYIFPTLKTDAMFSGITKGPSYDVTVNDVKSAKPYTYPLKKGANTFVVKVLEDKKVIGTYNIKINSGAAVAAATSGSASPVDGILDDISIKATIDTKAKYYLGDDLAVYMGAEKFNLSKTNYEFTTPADEIYIFPSLTANGLTSGLSKGPSYEITVNDAKGVKPFTYPLKKGSNTFLVKVLADKKVIQTYNIKINSANTAVTAASTPAKTTPAATGQLVVTGLSNGDYVAAKINMPLTSGGKMIRLTGADTYTTQANLTGVKVVNGQAAFKIYQDIAGGAISVYSGSNNNILLTIYKDNKGDGKFDLNGMGNTAKLGTVTVSFTDGKAPVTALVK
jgi:hypothetical protein